MRDTRPAWRNSTRRARLPANWDSELRPAVFARDGTICHWCGQPGADEIDHIIPGDDHSLDNLGPIHGWRTQQRCHVHKSAAEGAVRRPRLNRPEERHPAL